MISIIYEEAIEIMNVISKIKIISQYYKFLKIMYKNKIKNNMSDMFKGLKNIYKK